MQEGSLSAESARIMRLQTWGENMSKTIAEDLSQALNQVDCDMDQDSKLCLRFELHFESSIMSPSTATEPLLSVKHIEMSDYEHVLAARVIFSPDMWDEFVIGPGEFVRDMLEHIFKQCETFSKPFGSVAQLLHTEEALQKDDKKELGGGKHSHTYYQYKIQHYPTPALDRVTLDSVSFKAFTCKFQKSFSICNGIHNIGDMIAGMRLGINIWNKALSWRDLALRADIAPSILL